MKNKRGQVTIFIIIAVVVVALAGLIYLIAPKIGIDFGVEEKNPQDFIQTCVEDDLKDIVQTIGLQGGTYEPTNYFMYGDVPVAYLCYTPENYHACVLQKIAVEEGVEEEITKQISNIVDFCFNEMSQSYEDDGYSVSIRPGEVTVDLLPKKIVTSMDHEVTLSKEDSNIYDEFEIMLDNNLYELIKIGQYIVEWEKAYGGIDPLSVMQSYNFLDIDKDEMTDGTTVYALIDKRAGGVFQLATRSYVFPPGF